MRVGGALMIVIAIACSRSNAPPAPGDYADARRTFRTRLQRTAGSPQPSSPALLRDDAREVELASGELTLRAWVSKTAPSSPAPAVVVVHNGFAFSEEDWDATRPFRDAGFVAMTPILRGENGSPGAFTLLYDEVDDVIAAAELLAKQPGVDPARIFVVGHSAGGALALLAAMTSRRFRGAASLSGPPDVRPLAKNPEWTPFDPANKTELDMRSPLAFATSLKCPTRLYYGDEEEWLVDKTLQLAQTAKAAGLDVEAASVPGDHLRMPSAAIPRAIAFFQGLR
jgi:dipeptidyl aminopeptidase/acylaminoacyl peptidase